MGWLGGPMLSPARELSLGQAGRHRGRQLVPWSKEDWFWGSSMTAGWGVVLRDVWCYGTSTLQTLLFAFHREFI